LTSHRRRFMNQGASQTQSICWILLWNQRHRLSVLQNLKKKTYICKLLKRSFTQRFTSPAKKDERWNRSERLLLLGCGPPNYVELAEDWALDSIFIFKLPNKLDFEDIMNQGLFMDLLLQKALSYLGFNCWHNLKDLWWFVGVIFELVVCNGLFANFAFDDIVML
jgi:hypothetical protein